MSSRLLVPNGRVVFLYHTDSRKTEEENKFPNHPAVEFICASFYILGRHRVRHLITLKKRQII